MLFKNTEPNPRENDPEWKKYEERVEIWAIASRMESKADMLDEEGKSRKADALRAKAKKIRDEDPSKSLQRRLDKSLKEVIKEEEKREAEIIRAMREAGP
ncbi:unnamed protein product [Choristocarpus tenellus]